MPFVRRSSLAVLVSLMALVAGGLVALPSAGAFSNSQAHYLKAANKGVKQSHRWWSRGRHWYGSTLGSSQVVSLWGVVPLFEAMSGLQIAQPSRRHLRQLNRFAWGAQRYLNPVLEPVPGFGPRPGQHNPGKTTWFDDNGWWGLAFLDAYRATGNGRWLTDAEIAQNFISVSGWDSTPGRPGGLWWNTNHSFYAGESLAGGTLLSARLYAITHDQHYLDDALKYIAWGDVWLTDPATGLYARLRRPKTYYGQGSSAGSTAAAASDQKALSANPDEAAKLEAAGTPVPGPGEAQSAFNNYPPFAPSPMPYVNGPMILAHRIICDETGKKSYCQRADQLADITLAGLPALLDGAPVRLLVPADDAGVREGRQQRRLVRDRAAQCAQRPTPGARQARPLPAHLVRQEGVASQRPEGKPAAPRRQRGALRLDGRARALGLRPGARRQQRGDRDDDPDYGSDRIGEDESSAPDAIGRQMIDQRAHADLSFSGLRG